MTLDTGAYEIIEASDGEAALALAREHRPDLLLLDIMMPKLSGFEVCQALKENPATAGITIVMLTARAQESDRTHGEETGADDYFTKPFSPVALLRKVEDVLGERDGR
jgi:DNA-binding response OmpR family regulator